MSPAPSARVRDEWARRVVAEYTSAAVTQELGLWLTQIGASPDLVKRTLRIARDELGHAELSRKVLVAAGGAALPPVDRASLGLPRRAGEPLELDVTRACLSVFCLGETVAVPLFAELRRGCRAAPARAALDRILVDEVRHRDFGWVLLRWLLASPWGADVSALAARELPHMFAHLHTSYAPAAVAHATGVTALDRAWGLMAPDRYAAVLVRSIERDHLPRFSALGIDGATAWAAARGLLP